MGDIDRVHRMVQQQGRGINVTPTGVAAAVEVPCVAPSVGGRVMYIAKGLIAVGYKSGHTFLLFLQQ